MLKNHVIKLAIERCLLILADGDSFSGTTAGFPRCEDEVCDIVEAGSFFDACEYRWSVSAHEFGVAFHYGEGRGDEMGDVDLFELS